MKKTDSLGASALWGRIGAALVLLVSTGIGMAGHQVDAETQKTVVDSVSVMIQALGTLAAIGMTVVSKFRSVQRNQ